SPLVPLIPVDAIEPDDENSWVLVNNSRFLVGGKYLLGGTQQYQTNPFAAMYAAGYSKWTSRQLQFDAGIRLGLDKILPGLRFVARGAVDYNTSYSTSINNTYATYQATWTNYGGKDVIADITKFGNDLSTGVQNISNSSENQTLMFSGQFDYSGLLGDVHGLEANLVAHGYKRTITGQYHRNTNVSLGLRAAYNYDRRYYAEFNGALNHSAKFAPGRRNGFSPVGSLGWRISQEDFLKGSDVVDELRVNATYGMILQDLDIANYYLYANKFTADGDYWAWNDSHQVQTFQSRQGPNPDLTFVKRKEFNAGVEGSLWNGSLKFNAEFFTVDIDGLPTEASNIYPSYFKTYWPNSSFIPWINYGRQRRTGFDLGLNATRTFGEVTLSLGANVMYTSARNTRVSENVEYDWLRSEGAYTDALRGYRCLGFFQNEEEIATSAVVNNNTKPGDLKYQD
ncbi:MAG: SusC/RagA family TonB-linked outer membrane protein, partial [Duncaniella sp.]|nr:SusC/RagA family TonB-linked outer membrane protein [Duncaniella sp.]